MQDILVSMNVGIQVERRDDCWAAIVAPLGITVYGPTRGAAQERADQAVRFLVASYFKHQGKNLNAVREYLDRHGIYHAILGADDYSTTHQVAVALDAA